MASILSNKAASVFLLVLVSFVGLCSGSRKLASLYQPPPTLLTYHKGGLLQGDIPISILWYGKFTSAQKSIISDFLLSLTPPPTKQKRSSPTTTPTVSKWWNTVDVLVTKAGKHKTHISLANQVSDEHCSIGKLLKRSQLAGLASKANPTKAGVVLVLTAEDVAVESFCMSSCGSHGLAVTGSAYVWVGNSASQCPGQCAWPFHQPLYGPQSAPLVAPNGDVGVEGMVINIAAKLAGTVTNPFGNGYFQGDAESAVEVGSACPGVYGRGAYPGYAGELLVDGGSGASYNVEGVNGRKYMVPAMYDPATSTCSPVV